MYSRGWAVRHALMPRKIGRRQGALWLCTTAACHMLGWKGQQREGGGREKRSAAYLTSAMSKTPKKQALAGTRLWPRLSAHVYHLFRQLQAAVAFTSRWWRLLASGGVHVPLAPRLKHPPQRPAQRLRAAPALPPGKGLRCPAASAGGHRWPAPARTQLWSDQACPPAAPSCCCCGCCCHMSRDAAELT